MKKKISGKAIAAIIAALAVVGIVSDRQYIKTGS